MIRLHHNHEIGGDSHVVRMALVVGLSLTWRPALQRIVGRREDGARSSERYRDVRCDLKRVEFCRLQFRVSKLPFNAGP